MRLALLLVSILLLIVIVKPETPLTGKKILLEELSITVLEVKTNHVITQHPIIAEEFPGGVHFMEGEGYEALDSMPGHKFYLVKLELRNIGRENLHLIGKEYKVLRAEDGETFYPGVLSRKTRNASIDEIKNNYYPPLITILTLRPGQRSNGWIIFEIPEYIEPREFLWYSDLNSRDPSFVVKLS